MAADGSTTSELYGPQGLNATAPDISSSSSGGSQPRRREAAATASGREEEPRQQQQQQQAPAQQQDGGEAGVGSDGGRGGGGGGGGDGGSLGEAMRGAQERLAEESEAVRGVGWGGVRALSCVVQRARVRV